MFAMTTVVTWSMV